MTNRKRKACEIILQMAEEGYTYEEASRVLTMAKEVLWNNRKETKIDPAPFKSLLARR